MQKKVAAVIVTFNRLAKLKQTLERTFAEPFYAVVVVDNHSTDGTDQWLESLADPRLHVIHSPSNLGGAGGFNQGFDYAANRLPDADWLVAFDDDAYPEPGTLERFEALDIPAEVGSVAAAVYLPDGRISEMNRPSVNPFWHLRELFSTVLRGRSGFHVTDADYLRAEPREIDASSFVGFFMRLSLIRGGRVGLPRTELFIYTDDIIYVLQMRKAGVNHWFAPWLIFSHDCKTLSDGVEIYLPLWRAYFVIRNRIEMYRIASGPLFPLVLFVRVPSIFFSARHYPFGERLKFTKVARLAIWHGLRRDFRIRFVDSMRLELLVRAKA